ncbi:hypothetical protein [Streptomyces sp. AB3(2024)]|uniref:hypothetical protein n=1 Tax=Streptomyces sp. AB3(2024) TaxID=3317321 RepID=UPI0035A28794
MVLSKYCGRPSASSGRRTVVRVREGDPGGVGLREVLPDHVVDLRERAVDFPEVREQLPDFQFREGAGLADVGDRVDEAAGLAGHADDLRDGARLGRRTGAAGEHGGQDVEGDRARRARRVLAPLVPGDQRLAGLLHRGA